MKKLRLEPDSLSVESFATPPAMQQTGTVRARGCTVDDSCYCETAYAVCGTGPATIYSCDQSVNGICEFTAEGGCERTAVDCPDTSYQVCGTRQITPAC
ncbi:MAG TPA: hypothetical protein VF705_12245 [Longimicrobium sp.]|jgi:hypothetical protein